MNWDEVCGKSEAGVRLSVCLGGVTLASPVLLASGVWPMDPALWPVQTLRGVGGICTKGLTLEPREGNSGIRIWETPCGVLNSIGLQNRGVRVFVEEELPRMAATGIPVIANVAPAGRAEMEPLLAPLRSAGASVAAVELNLSCPNVADGGMAWGKTPEGIREAVRAARGCWPGPLWVKLTPQAPDMAAAVRAAEDCGADAVVVANTWLGAAMDLKRRRPVFDRVVAGFSGPAIFPLSLRCVWEAAEATTVPLIGSGGITSWENAAAMLLAGATAVQVGSGLFRDLDLPGKIVDGLAAYAASSGFENISDLVGAGRKRSEDR
jgi:dihydroorotate dehydrogenase (NAD+) catalytic subunit